MPWHYSPWWHMGFMWVFWLVLLILIVWLLVRAASDGKAGAPPDSPEQIAKRRYARGEINKDEYERMLNDLRR